MVCQTFRPTYSSGCTRLTLSCARWIAPVPWIESAIASAGHVLSGTLIQAACSNLQEVFNHGKKIPEGAEQPVWVVELPDALPDDVDLEIEMLAIHMLYAQAGRFQEGQDGYSGDLEVSMEKV